MIGEVHEGQSLLIKATIKNQDDDVVDIGDATAKKVIIEAPDGGREEFDASFTTDGADGKVQYLLAITVLDEVDKKHWEYQFIITRPGDLIYPTDIGSFEVQRNL